MGGQRRRRRGADSSRRAVGSRDGLDGKTDRQPFHTERRRGSAHKTIRDQDHQGTVFAEATIGWCGAAMTPSASNEGPFLGVDIGGTKVAVGLVGRDGQILKQARKPMVANGTAEAGL